MSDELQNETAEVAVPAKKAGRPPFQKKPQDTAEVVAPRKPHWPKGFVPSGDPIADTKILLAAAPKAMFYVPLAPGEPAGSEEIVQINGYKLTIKKGNMVELPMPCVQMLANKYKVEVETALRSSASSSADKIEALN